MIKIDKKTVLKNVSFALHQTRRVLSLQQPYVSEETDITQQQLSNYEHGATLPSLLSIIALADLYDVSIDYLVGRCDNSKAHKTKKVFKFKEEF